MPFEILIQVVVFILCLIEAWLEETVIALKNPSHPQYIKLNKKEHQLSALYWLVMVCIYVLLSVDRISAWYWLVVVLVISRRTYFEYALKLFRKGKRVKDIEGDQFWDTLSRRIFGKKGGYWELLFLIASIVLFNIFLLR
jgi:hypothetical protein